jgi:hypothetical protein
MTSALLSALPDQSEYYQDVDNIYPKLGEYLKSGHDSISKVEGEKCQSRN